MAEGDGQAVVEGKETLLEPPVDLPHGLGEAGRAAGHFRHEIAGELGDGKGLPGPPEGDALRCVLHPDDEPGKRPSPPGLEDVTGTVEPHPLDEGRCLPEPARRLDVRIPPSVSQVAVDAREPAGDEPVEGRRDLALSPDRSRGDPLEDETPSLRVLDHGPEQGALGAARRHQLRPLGLQLEVPVPENIGKNRGIQRDLPARLDRTDGTDLITGSSTASTRPPSSPRRHSRG